ncbi:Uncharacterised protein [Mycobacteroides abscessus subsp. abscessus]|nr:Uncharacterised protein [Mycobacteroides abscessus subsp. abscessus]
MEPLATTSDARLEASPNPPAKGNISELREGHGGGYLGGQPLWHRHRVRGIPRGVCGVVDW